MKIVFFLGRFPALSETFILNQITGLIDQGENVSIVSVCRPQNQEPVHNDVKKYNLLRVTKYVDLPEEYIPRIRNTISLLLTNFWKAPGPLLQALNIFKFGSLALSARLFFYAIAFLPKKDADIIHCHFGMNGEAGSKLRSIGIIKGKIVTTYYGLDLTSELKTLGAGMYRQLLALGDFHLPICNYFRSILLDLSFEKEKIAIHHLGVDLNKFKRKNNKSEKRKKITLLTVGRLVEKKGQRYAIEAVANITKKGMQVEYLIAGDGPMKQELEALVRHLEMSGVVQFLGPVVQEEVIDLLQKADIFLAPSVTAKNGDQEGTPTVIMEAMAAGLPVISTYHSGIPEIILDADTGFLVKEKDVDALTEKLAYLIKCPEIGSQMGARGREHIEKEFNIDTLVKR
ncbi:MAG: glycosyltransferase, partial [Nitrospinota bacterium]